MVHFTKTKSLMNDLLNMHELPTYNLLPENPYDVKDPN